MANLQEEQIQNIKNRKREALRVARLQYGGPDIWKSLSKKIQNKDMKNMNQEVAKDQKDSWETLQPRNRGDSLQNIWKHTSSKQQAKAEKEVLIIRTEKLLKTIQKYKKDRSIPPEQPIEISPRTNSEIFEALLAPFPTGRIDNKQQHKKVRTTGQHSHKHALYTLPTPSRT